jgi:carbohydrate kinase (thermoresistant glucokinase family)
MILILAGVSGSGKTTVGALVAGRLHWRFADADTFHPAANVAKMHAGIPLADADRWPWLQAIAAWMDERIAQHESAVVTCSALKRCYRDLLLGGRPEAQMIFLAADRHEIAQRLAARHGHFFPARLAASQFDALEPPQPDERAVTVLPAGDLEETADAIIKLIRADATGGGHEAQA